MATFEHSGDESSHDDLYKVRHSLAHVLAQAVLELRPGSTLGFGPPIADGFYYDFILTEPLTEEDLPKAEYTGKDFDDELFIELRTPKMCEDLFKLLPATATRPVAALLLLAMLAETATGFSLLALPFKR